MMTMISLLVDSAAKRVRSSSFADEADMMLNVEAMKAVQQGSINCKQWRCQEVSFLGL